MFKAPASPNTQDDQSTKEPSIKKKQAWIAFNAKQHVKDCCAEILAESTANNWPEEKKQTYLTQINSPTFYQESLELLERKREQLIAFNRIFSALKRRSDKPTAQALLDRLIDSPNLPIASASDLTQLVIAVESLSNQHWKSEALTQRFEEMAKLYCRLAEIKKPGQLSLHEEIAQYQAEYQAAKAKAEQARQEKEQERQEKEQALQEKEKERQEKLKERQEKEQARQRADALAREVAQLREQLKRKHDKVDETSGDESTPSGLVANSLFPSSQPDNSTAQEQEAKRPRKYTGFSAT